MARTAKINDLVAIAQGPPSECFKYLNSVSIQQFQKDVEALVKKYSDKGAIKEAIEALNKIVA